MKNKPKRGRGQGGLIKKKGSDNWYAVWRQNGRQFCKSTGTSVKQYAEAKLQAYLGRKQTGAPLAPELSKLRYEDLRNSYLLSAQAKGRKSLYTNSEGVTSFTSLKHLDKFFAGWRASAIKPDAIRKFVLQRQAAGAANGTINRALAALKAMFRLAVKEDKLQVVPYIEMLKEADPRKGFLTVAQYETLFAALPERYQPVLALGYYRGLRLGEIRKLQWEDVDLRTGVIRLAPGETKSGKGRIIPLNAELLKMLKELRRKTNSPFVFGEGRPLGSFRKAWYSACVESGLGHFEERDDGYRIYVGTIFHDLRRSAIMNMTQGGVDPTVAKAISGHETDSVFKRYNIVPEERLIAGSQKVDAFIESQRQSLVSDAVVGAEIIRPALPGAKRE